MTESIKVPISTTDPYAPESSSFEAVRVLLTSLDGSTEVVETDRRVVGRRLLVRRGEKLFTYVGSDQRNGRWVRLYVESKVVEL